MKEALDAHKKASENPWYMDLSIRTHLIEEHDLYHANLILFKNSRSLDPLNINFCIQFTS